MCPREACITSTLHEARSFEQSVLCRNFRASCSTLLAEISLPEFDPILSTFNSFITTESRPLASLQSSHVHKPEIIRESVLVYKIKGGRDASDLKLSLEHREELEITY